MSSYPYLNMSRLEQLKIAMKVVLKPILGRLFSDYGFDFKTRKYQKTPVETTRQQVAYVK